MVLAVNEALANTAEFAYVGMPGAGMVAVAAVYDDDTDTLAVTVTDAGRWRRAEAASSTVPVQHSPRGRGLRLMRALADETQIDTSERGTQVSLTWTNLLTSSI